VDTGPCVYELREVHCGKPTCSKCPHGPYWYLLIKLRGGGRVVRYIGKTAPAEVDSANESNDVVNREGISGSHAELR